MRVTEREDQICRVDRKLLMQAAYKISTRLQRLPPAEIRFHQNQSFSASRRGQSQGSESQRAMDRASHVVLGGSPISSVDSNGRCNICARDADLAGERRMAKSARLRRV